jgi:hypothetical protein
VKESACPLKLLEKNPLKKDQIHSLKEALPKLKEFKF